MSPGVPATTPCAAVYPMFTCWPTRPRSVDAISKTLASVPPAPSSSLLSPVGGRSVAPSESHWGWLLRTYEYLRIPERVREPDRSRDGGCAHGRWRPDSL